MKIGLCVFPPFWDTHKGEGTDLGQRLEPSVLYMAPDMPGVESVFLDDNTPQDDIDLYLCSVYTRGLKEFKEFSKKVGRDKVIAGGYHPTAMPLETSFYAHKVVTGLCGDIESVIESSNNGVFRGAFAPRKMHRELIDMSRMHQVFPDVYPGMMTGSSNSSVGCPYDCDFCSTPTLSGRKMYASTIEAVEEDISSLQSFDVKAVFIRDESFATHPDFFNVVKVYGAAGFDVLYSFGTGSAMTDAKTKHLSENNWHSLCFGLEDVGVSYNKNRKLTNATELCHKYGVNITLSFIVNPENKTKDEALKNYHSIFDAFLHHRPTQVCSNFLMPFPGTGLWPKYKDKITEDDFENYDSKTPILAPADLVEWHKKMSLAVQLEWYYSPEYQKLRPFECGDNQHLRFLQLQEKFDMQDGKWQEWFKRQS